MRYKHVIKNIAILIVSILAIGLVTTISTDKILDGQDEENLAKLTAVIEKEIGFGDIDSYNEIVNKNYDADIRVTIIDKSGNVLAESNFDIEGMDNHIDREEVQSLINGEESYFSSRLSDTANLNMLYYAKKIPNQNNTDFVILRVSTTSGAIFDYFNIMLPIAITTIAITLIISVLLAVILNARVDKSMLLIKQGLKSIEDESFVKILPSFMNKELNSQLEQINEIQDKIKANIEQIEIEKEKLKAVINTLDNGIIILDENYLINIINNKAMEIFGCDNSVVKKDFNILQLDLQMVNVIYAMNNEKSYDSFILKINENHYNIIVAKKGNNIVILFNDITELKDYQLYKDEFFAMASHELKTPVTSIVGFIELYDHATTDEERIKYISRINMHSKRIMTLVTDMLEIIRLDEKTDLDKSQKIEIDKIVNEKLADLSYDITKNELKVNVSGSAFMQGNSSYLSELCLNLLSNAVRYNKHGGKINVEISQIDRGIKLIIEDSGIGIPNDKLDRIFERFYCVDKSRSKKSGGTGLGLAIVMRIVKLYNGKIDVESIQGKGSKFTVTLFDKND